MKYDKSGDFRECHFDAMVKFNELHQNKYFTIGHNGIVFKNYVGVIQVGGLTIEILPKADKKADADKNLWQSVLLNMLKGLQAYSGGIRFGNPAQKKVSFYFGCLF